MSLSNTPTQWFNRIHDSGVFILFEIIKRSHLKPVCIPLFHVTTSSGIKTSQLLGPNIRKREIESIKKIFVPDIEQMVIQGLWILSRMQVTDNLFIYLLNFSFLLLTSKINKDNRVFNLLNFYSFCHIGLGGIEWLYSEVID